ncbi:MAG TPA: bifunctional oligoribonuclease/PAP phosphatase NrnA [Clostridiaceae bacterium]|jgi:phosphoesterase RecJ-like protein|nr:bifunctional oligoribonuclease/PAP phosphatase NrnA [Clostridiaceae bacterium]
MTLDNILEEINNANSIVILTHENPDGDAVGSSLALYHALKAYGKNVEVIIPEYSRTFNFLPGTNEIKKEGTYENYDLAISLDCASMNMLNGYVKYFENAKTRVVIDHHGTNSMYGDLNFVNPDSPACAQILVVVLNYFKMEITKEIGTCILAGIITDTGGFKYSGVTAETFEFVAWLLNKGVNVSSVYRKVLQVRTKGNFELNRIASNRLEFLEDGKIAFTYITRDDEESVNAETGDHEGIVDIGRDIEGVEVSIFIRETKTKGVKISLRSSEYVNVSDIALLFGGGGHPRAAGCNMQATIQQAKERIVNEVKANLK